MPEAVGPIANYSQGTIALFHAERYCKPHARLDSTHTPRGNEATDYTYGRQHHAVADTKGNLTHPQTRKRGKDAHSHTRHKP